MARRSNNKREEFDKKSGAEFVKDGKGGARAYGWHSSSKFGFMKFSAFPRKKDAKTSNPKRHHWVATIHSDKFPQPITTSCFYDTDKHVLRFPDLYTGFTASFNTPARQTASGKMAKGVWVSIG